MSRERRGSKKKVREAVVLPVVKGMGQGPQSCAGTDRAGSVTRGAGGWGSEHEGWAPGSASTTLPSVCVCVYMGMYGAVDYEALSLITLNFTFAFGALNASAITHGLHQGHSYPMFKVFNGRLAEMTVQLLRRIPFPSPISDTQIAKKPPPCAGRSSLCLMGVSGCPQGIWEPLSASHSSPS